MIADAGFRDPPALEAAMDAVLDVHERVIGIFVAPVSKWGCFMSQDCSTATDATPLPSRVSRTNREYAMPFNHTMVPPGSPSQMIDVPAEVVEELLFLLVGKEVVLHRCRSC